MNARGEKHFDVVVIGAGLAGHCAALSAAENGAQVALLEKTAKPGGSTLMSAGSFAFSGTDLQRAAGIEDSPTQLARELMKVSGGKADPTLVSRYVEQQAEMYAWLKAQGVVFHQISLSANTTVPRTHPTNSKQLISALHGHVIGHPQIAYFPSCAANRLLINARGEVRGCEVEADAEVVRFCASRGVVIATGGFTRNPELMQKFAPKLVLAPTWGGVGNTGDGLTMAAELGADLIDMGYVTGTFGVALNHFPDKRVDAGDELLLRMAIYRGAIAVNLNAERFADESLSYKQLGTLCLAQPEAVAIQIFDRPIMDQSVANPSVNDLKGALEKGVIRQADCITELARAIRLDPEKLEKTLARYNNFAASGHDDDFGRIHLGGGYGKLVEINTPPYYALPCSTVVLSTYCGLRTDPDTRVLTVRGKAIDRLFAAGETVGGFHGTGYMSGSSLGKAAIFGRLAGAMASRENAV